MTKRNDNPAVNFDLAKRRICLPREETLVRAGRCALVLTNGGIALATMVKFCEAAAQLERVPLSFAAMAVGIVALNVNEIRNGVNALRKSRLSPRA